MNDLSEYYSESSEVHIQAQSKVEDILILLQGQNYLYNDATKVLLVLNAISTALSWHTDVQNI